MSKKPDIFVALDVADAAEAIALAKKLVPVNPFLKVGLELFTAEGPAILRSLKDLGGEIFLDLKFHDIPNTVSGAVRSAVRMGARYLNVHCSGGLEMMKAAVKARNEEADRLGVSRPSLLGVTVLTSLDDIAIQEVGFPRSASAQVKVFVELAQDAGLDGVVCSAHELPLVRQLAGSNFLTMVPGIRPSGSAAHDQKRILTPQEAAAAGASCIVIGRPITEAADPVVVLKEILDRL